MLLALLDEALDLDAGARGAWIDGLAESHADLQPTLRQMLSETSQESAHGAFKRSVALKPLFASGTGRLSERMTRARDILAALDHPHIARFYDAGVDAQGRRFMAME